jgi:translation initiation factor eIF-2B subunit gamma
MSSSSSPAPFRRPVSVDPSVNTPGAPARSYPYEFQVVLLCGSSGSSMFPLTCSERPKCLLPVANRPIIHYQLEALVANGFKEVIVVTKSCFTRYLEKSIDSSGLSSHIHIQLLSLDSWIGTADALRQVSHSLFTDFFVISGDLITNTRLHYLADVYRSRDASMVALLSDTMNKVTYEGVNITANATAKKKSNQQDDHGELDAQFIGLESKADCNRLVYYKHKADVEETLKIRKSLLQRYVSWMF